MRPLPVAVVGLFCVACLSLAREERPQPIRLHPDNPHYFLWRGKPAVLITSGEHYGAVLNGDFDYKRYLEALESYGFNQTRAFSGTYREVAGSFGIEGNTLAPRAEAFLSPWARSDERGAGDGLNKFDLSKWDPAYFGRLRDFVGEAGRRGVVVELVLFCTMYDDAVWAVSPMNPANNVNGLGDVGRGEVYSGGNAKLMAFQEALAAKLATELREFDNVYFEICNEPYERGGLTKEWNDRIVGAIVAAEAGLPAERRHLIAQGFARGEKIEKPNSNVSVFNFHAASADDVARNYALGRVTADDETGGKGGDDLPYRAEAWEFMLAGGGVFSHLDFSFTCATPAGAEGVTKAPGGGGAGIRRQLRVLKRFLESFDFVAMRPDDGVVKAGVPGGGAVRVLARRGRAYAIYVRGGDHRVTLTLELPTGRYEGEWVDVKTGERRGSQGFHHGGGAVEMASPRYVEDVALRIVARKKGE